MQKLGPAAAYWRAGGAAQICGTAAQQSVAVPRQLGSAVAIRHAIAPDTLLTPRVAGPCGV